MNKFGVNFFLGVFAFGALLNVSCRQTETNPSAPINQTSEVKSSPLRVSAKAQHVAEPVIAADADGDLYVVYVAHGTEKSADVYLQKFDSQMKPNGEPVRVNPNSGEATAWRGDAPTIAVSIDRIVYVGWTKAVKTSAGNGTDLSLSVSRDGGKSFAAPVKINDDIKPASHGMHSLAIGTDNTVFMAWLDERNLKNEASAANFNEGESAFSDFQFVKIHHNSNQSPSPKKVEKNENAEPNSEVFFAASNDGGRTFSANVKVSSDVCPCCKTSLLAAPDGRIYASWRQVLAGDFRHIAVSSTADAGKTFSAPTIVSDDRWKINACPVSGAALAIGENNRLKVAWFTAGDAGKSGLYEAESSDYAKSFTERVLVSEGEISGTPTLTANLDNLKVLWEADGKIYQAQSSVSREFAKTELISDASLPSFVSSKNKVFAVYIRKEIDKRSIWLTAF